MIVKNEEKVLARCLDSIKDLMDEIIIVDTGSTDNTKAIAQKYTDKIYDFAWNDNFSDARNFSFQKATMDYIYVPDADEYLDEENRHQFYLLKEYINPQVEIVQMMYHTINHDTVLNIQKEYRPKLFRRLRTFTWIDPIHETVRLNPLVFNSEIIITHAPLCDHSKRDFSIYQKTIKQNTVLSNNVISMYATELIKVGTTEDLIVAKEYFQQIFECSDNEELRVKAACVLVRCARLSNDFDAMMKLLPEYPLADTTSEICYDFGLFYFSRKEYLKAIDWLRTAINDAPYALDVHTCGDIAIQALLSCYQELMKITTDAEDLEIYNSEFSVYTQMLADWECPIETVEY